MTISIGLITARNSLENLKNCDKEMNQVCKIHYLTYDSLTELCDLYSRHAWKFDGLLFSGSFPMEYIINHIGPIAKPHLSLELKDRDYYLVVARLFADNSGMDFTRVYFDVSVDPCIIDNIVPPDGRCYLPTYALQIGNYTSLGYVTYEDIMDVYRSFWQKKKFNMFVTRFTNLANMLEKEKIPHVLLKPCRETILDCFHELVRKVQENLQRNSLVACGIIELNRNFRTNEYSDKLDQILNNFSQAMEGNLMFRKNATGFDVITSAEYVRTITESYTSCPLFNILSQNLSTPPNLGWGIGFNVMTAYKNAKKAVCASTKNTNNYSYLVSETQKMIGPLSGNLSLSYDIQPNARILSLAKSLGIASINLEKILFLQKEKNMIEFTSSDLVYYLDITQRSAARILAKLYSSNLAIPIRCTNLNGIGRPLTIYKIDLESIF